MSDQSTDAREIQHIIGENTRVAAIADSGVETLVYSELARTEFPDSFRQSVFTCFHSALCVAGIFAIVYFWKELEDPLHKAALVAGISTLLFFRLLDFLSQRRRLHAFHDDLCEALSMLQEIYDKLVLYRSEFDERTRRYFHCVTSTKVQAYFILNQLQVAIEKRVKALATLLHNPNKRELRAAHRLLFKDIVFNDGAAVGTGVQRSVNPAVLRGTIADIIDTLERGIEEIERELDLAQEEMKIYSDSYEVEDSDDSSC